MRLILIDLIGEIPWRNPRRHPNKLQACSPFRDGDDTPSFSVNLDPSSDKFGWWNDSGAVDRRWRAGPPEKLIAFLRNITEEEARELIYGDGRAGPGEYISLRLPQDNVRAPRKPLNITFEPQVSEYLLNRGISADIQQMFRTGYDPRSRAVILPWWAPDGRRIFNVKYRSTWDKRFWYAKGGWPIRDLLYGIDIVYQRNIKRVAVCEAEIDCLSLYSMGIPAIATGGAQFSTKKRDLILRSPIEEIIIVRDSDTAGRAWRNQVYEALRGKVDVSLALVPRGYKDVNEAWTTGDKRLGKIRKITSNFQILA
ncbi:toprim domain-containing protein [Paenibacillus sp. VCA1]|uniref:toprim domain-containing protein n=1 Tax=Paenibacillus sp. VCA1 TaxID=3039148 RepID=UPI0028714948|nr:toprim domain-containing protein [Paenibacillus sp. VCA1]MDR9852952.1 toprim domain-containing protein [Paenibacillus sp. VCA1]